MLIYADPPYMCDTLYTKSGKLADKLGVDLWLDAQPFELYIGLIERVNAGGGLEPGVCSKVVDDLRNAIAERNGM